MQTSRTTFAGSIIASLVLSATLAPGASARARKMECQEGYQAYEETARKLKTTFSTRSRNNGGKEDTYVVRVTRSGTVTSEFSAELETKVGGGFPGFEASVRAQFGTKITRAMTAERGEELRVRVPPRREVQVRYGVYTRVYKGLVLSSKNPPGLPMLTPVPLPPNCNLHAVASYSVRVATPETGFVKSKPRRIDG